MSLNRKVNNESMNPPEDECTKIQEDFTQNKARMEFFTLTGSYIQTRKMLLMK